ncbi:hypothetical protein JGU66_15395 [Myxococcaceae bacterium JPH2]|nr:hypothetical protein [Myxococcaceae bacterium JPH2]
MAKRLPVLLLAALGLWLWRSTSIPERELVFELEGPGWASARALDIQVVGEDGHIEKREERFFPSGPPPRVEVQAALPEGTFRALLFVKREGQEARLRVEDTLSVGEDARIVRQLRLPDASR